MTRTVLLLIGTVMVLLGILFALQGFGVIGGSAMSGTTTWSILGPLIAIAGAVLVARGLRARR